jgi:hypothetical protein
MVGAMAWLHGRSGPSLVTMATPERRYAADIDIICLEVVKNSRKLAFSSARNVEFAFRCRFFLLHSEESINV